MQIGKIQTLPIIKIVDFGVYLIDEDENEILLPKRYEPEEVNIGDKVEVFLYTDSEDRPIATTLTPIAVLGEIAVLEVVDTTRKGCFLDLGIAKDIFMPTKFPANYKKGDKVVVKITKDKQERLIAKKGIKETLKSAKGYKPNKEVEIIVFEKSDMGYGCVTDKKYYGLIYANEVFQPLAIGEKRIAYVKKNRDDGKLDLSLKKLGVAGVNEELESLLTILRNNSGVLRLHYDSPPEEIAKICALSKKGFKRALSEGIKEGVIHLVPGEKIELSRQG